MIKWIFFIYMISVGFALGQTLLGVTTSPTGGGTPIPPSCSNSLVFSDGCNSQYLSLFKGMI